VDNVLQILPLACEYLTKEIITKCEDVICRHCTESCQLMEANKYNDVNITLNKILNYLSVCEEFKLDEHVVVAVADIASYIELPRLEERQSYKSLSDTTKLRIAKQRLQRFEKCRHQNYVYQEQFLSLFNFPITL